MQPMTTPRVTRGRQTESLLAEYLKPWFPDAERIAAGLPGHDLKKVGRLAFEVKATTALPLLPALRQVRKRALPDEIPLVIWRPNGYGPERIKQWVAATDLDVLVDLLGKAGMLE